MFKPLLNGCLEETIARSDYEGMQHFISGSNWDERALLNQFSCDVDGLLGGDSRSALIIDESGFAGDGGSFEIGFGVEPERYSLFTFALVFIGFGDFGGEIDRQKTAQMKKP